MGFWARIFGREAKSASTFDVFRDFAAPVKSGAHVTWKTALEVTTVLACVRVKANGIAQVPFKLFAERADGGKDPARDHPLYDVLHRRPNPWQTSFEFRQQMEIHRQLTGNAYAFINRVRGQVRELIPFEPQQVTVRQAGDYTLSYEVTAPGGERRIFPAETVWHLRGPSWNGWLGMEVIHLAREAVGLAMRTEEAHARLHRNGVQPSGLYTVDAALNEEQYKLLREWIERHHGGPANAGRPFILDRGATWVSQAMTGVDAQHLETRSFQIEEICRAFGVFPQMVGHSDKTSTYASAEQFFLAHVVHSLGPEYEAWEQSADCSLLTPQERRDGLYTKFLLQGLMRGAMKDRAEFYTKLYGVGAINPNEIRALEEMNPYPGGGSFRVPLNMGDPSAAPQEDQSDDAAS